MSIQSKVHFWRFTLRRRWILMRLIFCGNGVARAKILKKSGVFGAMGDNCWYEPHKLPSEPQLVFMGNNVNIAADVAILNHDIMAAMINRMDGMPKCNIRVGGGNHREQCVHRWALDYSVCEHRRQRYHWGGQRGNAGYSQRQRGCRLSGEGYREI